MNPPPWLVAVRFWSDALYRWAKDIPGVRWDKQAKVLLVPTDVLPLFEKKARELEVSLRFPGVGHSEDSERPVT
jgi:hypothetical protein